MGKVRNGKRYRHREKGPYWHFRNLGNIIMNEIRSWCISGSPAPHEVIDPDVRPPMILRNEDTSVMKYISANLTLPGGWIVQRNSTGIAVSHIGIASLNPTVAKCIALLRDGNLIIRANGNMVALTERVIGNVYPFDMELSERNKNVITNTISRLAFRLNDMKVCSGIVVDRCVSLEPFDGNVVSCLSDDNTTVLRSNNCQWLNYSRICHQCREITRAISYIDDCEQRTQEETEMESVTGMTSEGSVYERRLSVNAEDERDQSEIDENWRAEPKRKVLWQRLAEKTARERTEPTLRVCLRRLPEMCEDGRRQSEMAEDEGLCLRRLPGMCEDGRRQSEMAEDGGLVTEFSEDESVQLN